MIKFARGQYQYFDGLDFLLRAFYDCINRDAPVPISYSEILRVSELMDRIIDQLGEHLLCIR